MSCSQIFNRLEFKDADDALKVFQKANETPTMGIQVIVDGQRIEHKGFQTN